MKKLFLFLLISIFLISFVSAWWCGGKDLNDCPTNYPQEICINGISMCGASNIDANEYCNIGFLGKWEDYKFCKEGYIANCDAFSKTNNMACCPIDYPKWSEKTTSCWKDEWECTRDGHCDSDKVCKNHKCKTDPCKYMTCSDYCQNSIRFYDGYCKNGECQYTEKTCTHGCSGEFCAEDPCKGVLCEDKCENGVWFHDGDCVNGNCIYTQDTCEFGCGKEMCKSTPCEGITCEDYCSGTTLFHSGKCINGECTNFQGKPFAEECGSKGWYKNIWIWVGLGGFIIIIVFGIWYWRKR